MSGSFNSEHGAEITEELKKAQKEVETKKAQREALFDVFKTLDESIKATFTMLKETGMQDISTIKAEGLFQAKIRYAFNSVSCSLGLGSIFEYDD